MNIISKDQVKSVYSGRPGCACGCLGNHTESPRSISIIVNKINKVANGQIAGTIDDQSSSGFGRYIAADTDSGRVLIAYLKDAS